MEFVIFRKLSEVIEHRQIAYFDLKEKINQNMRFGSMVFR